MKKIFPIFMALIYIALFGALAASWVYFLRYRDSQSAPSETISDEIIPNITTSDEPVSYQIASYQPAAYQETNAVLNNPFCGFYQMIGYLLSEEDPSGTKERAVQVSRSGSGQLHLVEINLLRYSDSDLSDNALKQLDSILAAYRSSKCQVILRFIYDWDGKAAKTEPTTIDQIYRHMDQVGAIVNQYTDCVFMIQSSFVGNYGEMNSAHYGTTEDTRLLMTRLANATDPSIYLAVRTPSQLRGVLQTRTPISEENAYDGSLASRLGLFNDGMLGSETDLGTYDESSNAETTEPQDKGTRDEEIAYQDVVCQFVPNGGEVVIANTYNDLDNAILDLSQMHVSYLNSSYDSNVLNKWRESAYHGDDCFDGINGYDYIEAHLGYRYVVNGSDLFYDPFDVTSTQLSLTIQNTGFAPAYRMFDGAVTLENMDTGLQLLVPVSLDNRTIKAGSETTFTLPLNIISLTDGTYRVSFSLSDPYTGQTILFANDDTDDKDRIHLGTLTIETVSQEGLLSSLQSR